MEDAMKRLAKLISAGCAALAVQGCYIGKANISGENIKLDPFWTSVHKEEAAVPAPTETPSSVASAAEK
jgi:hypothetical protein